MPEFDPFLKGLPSDELAERFLIATSIQSEEQLKAAILNVRPEHMSLNAHRIIWQWVCSAYDAGSIVSPDTLMVHFSSGTGSSDLDAIGGFTYMSEFVTGFNFAPAIPDYTAKILDTYARRCLMLKCNDALIRLSNRNEPIEGISQEIEEQARASAAIGKQSSGFKNFEDMIRESGGFETFLRRGKGDALSYPWPALNRITKGGMRPGQSIVIAGPSGKGKTALALNIIFRTIYAGLGVPLLFSLEMPADEIGSRMLALSSGVDSYRFDRLDENERDMIRTGRDILTENQYLVDDEDCATMAAIRSKTKAMIARTPVPLVVIDTIQLVEGRKGVKESREQEIATITRSMKRMAMQLKVPVIGLSQLNDVEDGKEPSIKNMRDSRTIWHNANIVMFLHFTRPYDMQNGMPVGEMDLILAKHRGGAEGRLKLDFHAPTGRFYERDGVNQ